MRRRLPEIDYNAWLDPDLISTFESDSEKWNAMIAAQAALLPAKPEPIVDFDAGDRDAAMIRGLYPDPLRFPGPCSRYLSSPGKALTPHGKPLCSSVDKGVTLTADQTAALLLEIDATIGAAMDRMELFDERYAIQHENTGMAPPDAPAHWREYYLDAGAPVRWAMAILERSEERPGQHQNAREYLREFAPQAGTLRRHAS